MFIKILFASLTAFFSMAGFSGQAAALPGEPFEQYHLKFGVPSNASASALRKVGSEKIKQFYWMEAKADPLLTGELLKGNLVVLFKKSPTKESDVQAPGSLNLISTREIYLVRVSAAAFNSLLGSFSEKWKVISKRTHIHSFRSLDRSRTNEVQNGLSARSAQAIHPVFGPVADKSFRASDPKVGRSDRPYDLYQLVSADRRFNAEISYSPLEAIVPLPSGSSKTAPVFNLWIYITQTH